PRCLARGCGLVKEAVAGPGTGTCTTRPCRLPRAFLLREDFKRASAPNNRHSRRGLAQANSMCSPHVSPSHNKGVSPWGQHIESSYLMAHVPLPADNAWNPYMETARG